MHCLQGFPSHVTLTFKTFKELMTSVRFAIFSNTSTIESKAKPNPINPPSTVTGKISPSSDPQCARWYLARRGGGWWWGGFLRSAARINKPGTGRLGANTKSASLTSFFRRTLHTGSSRTHAHTMVDHNGIARQVGSRWRRQNRRQTLSTGPDDNDCARQLGGGRCGEKRRRVR